MRASSFTHPTAPSWIGRSRSLADRLVMSEAPAAVQPNRFVRRSIVCNCLHGMGLGSCSLCRHERIGSAVAA